MIVSGFSAGFASLNGAHVLARAGTRVWVDATSTMQVRGTADGWRVEVGIGTSRFAQDTTPQLNCSGDHPVGSGTLVAPTTRQTGQYTIY